MTCSPFGQNSKCRDVTMRRCVLRSQLFLPLCFLHSFTAVWPGLISVSVPSLLSLSFMRMFLLWEQWSCLPGSPHITRRTQAQSSPLYHYAWDVFTETRPGILVTEASRCLRWEKISGQKLILSLEKNTATSTCKGSLLLKENTSVSSQHRSGSSWGKETTFPWPIPLPPCTDLLLVLGETFIRG